MTNKFYDKLKTIIKSIVVPLLVIFIYAFIINIKLPYVIESPGDLINIDKRLSGDIYETKGSINLTYVTVRKCNILTLAASLFNSSWDVLKIDDITLDNESLKESNIRSQIDLDSSLSASYYLSYTKANKEINIKNKKNYIIHIYENSDTNLEVGDLILSINDTPINKIEDIYNILNEANENDKLIIKVKNDKKEYTRYANVKEQDNEKRLGIAISTVLDFETNPKIEYKGEERESGPSGGLMFTLAIYNALTQDDITKGYKISGTGTIDMNGDVGEVGGIKHKLAGAVKNKADIFLVPKENYDEAIKLKNKNNYKIKIIKAENFNQVLEVLKEIK